jgi:hypothetical protein
MPARCAPNLVSITLAGAMKMRQTIAAKACLVGLHLPASNELACGNWRGSQTPFPPCEN